MNGEGDIHPVRLPWYGRGGRFETGVGKAMVKVIVQDGVAVVGNVIVGEGLPFLGVNQAAQLVLRAALVTNDAESPD